MGALDNLDSNLSGETGSATAYTGQVYLGKKEVPAAKGVIRGQKIDTGKQYGDETLSIAQAKAKYLTDAQLREKWNTTLRKNGFGTDPLQARALWEISIAGASDWYATSNGQQKVTPEQYLTWYAGGKKEAKVPTRQIYNVTPEEIDADIEEIAVKRLGRTLQDADRNAEWYKDLVKGVQNLYSQGIVSEPSKLVKNKKTGQMENIVAQSPQFSKEQVTKKITAAVEEADPISLQRKQDLDFANWAFNKIGGGR